MARLEQYSMFNLYCIGHDTKFKENYSNYVKKLSTAQLEELMQICKYFSKRIKFKETILSQIEDILRDLKVKEYLKIYDTHSMKPNISSEEKTYIRDWGIHMPKNSYNLIKKLISLIEFMLKITQEKLNQHNLQPQQVQ
jgi:hypothetical protein